MEQPTLAPGHPGMRLPPEWSVPRIRSPGTPTELTYDLHGGQVDPDFLETGKARGRVVLPTLAVITSAPVVGAFGWVVQPACTERMFWYGWEGLSGDRQEFGLFRACALLPVPINLGEVLRVPVDQRHVFFGVVRLHPRTEDLQGRPERTRGGWLGNGVTRAGVPRSKNTWEMETEMGRSPSGAFL